LESLAAEAECVVQAGNPPACAHYGSIVGQVAFDAAPNPNDMKLAQLRRYPTNLSKLGQGVLRLHVGAPNIRKCVTTRPTPENHVSARDLAQIDHFIRYFRRHAQHGMNGVRRRLRYRHLWTTGHKRDSLAELRR